MDAQGRTKRPYELFAQDGLRVYILIGAYGMAGAGRVKEGFVGAKAIFPPQGDVLYAQRVDGNSFQSGQVAAHPLGAFRTDGRKVRAVLLKVHPRFGQELVLKGIRSASYSSSPRLCSISRVISPFFSSKGQSRTTG